MQFGGAVALAEDTLAVGARLESSGAVGTNGDQADTSAFESGAVYVFTRAGRSWSQQAYVKASKNEGNALFGDSVALSGHTLVVSAPVEVSSEGAVYAFH